MLELLQTIQIILFNTLLVMACIYAATRPKNVSLLISLAVVLINELLLDKFEPLLIDPSIITDPMTLKITWYLLFTSSELLTAFLIVRIHDVYDELPSTGTRITIVTYIALSVMHVCFFCLSLGIDRELFKVMYTIVSKSLFLGVILTLLYGLIKSATSNDDKLWEHS